MSAKLRTACLLGVVIVVVVSVVHAADNCKTIYDRECRTVSDSCSNSVNPCQGSGVHVRCSSSLSSEMLDDSQNDGPFDILSWPNGDNDECGYQQRLFPFEEENIACQVIDGICTSMFSGQWINTTIPCDRNYGATACSGQ